MCLPFLIYLTRNCSSRIAPRGRITRDHRTGCRRTWETVGQIES